MNKQPPRNDLAILMKPVARFFQRFHLTLFIVILVGGLAYGVVSLYELINTASSPTPVDGAALTATAPATASSTTINQATISQLETMYPSSSAPSSVTLPTGRINPFGE